MTKKTSHRINGFIIDWSETNQVWKIFKDNHNVMIFIGEENAIAWANRNGLTTIKQKCYIAGKIGELPEHEYKANFEQAKREVIEMGYEPVSPVDLPHNHGRTWNDYMREDLIEMLKCTRVYAIRNWRLSPGAIIEINTALSVGLNIIHQDTRKREQNEINEQFESTQLPCKK